MGSARVTPPRINVAAIYEVIHNFLWFWCDDLW